MPGAIAGAIAAVLGQQNVRYNALRKECVDELKYEVLKATQSILDKEFKQLESDLYTAMNVQEVLDGEIIEMLKIKLKKETASKIISKARVAFTKEMHEAYKLNL